MKRRPATSLSLLSTLAWLGACAGTGNSEIRRIYDPELESVENAKLAASRLQNDFTLALMQIDQSMESYVHALNHRGIASQDSKVKQLDRLMREKVSGRPEGSNVKRLIALASDSTDKIRQGIALAALGFASNSEVMPVILQGAQLEDPFLVDRAVLGLAILKDPRTPPGVVAAIVENKNYHDEGRIQAAWALYVLQGHCLRTDEIPPIWARILTDSDDVHPGIIGTAVRGLGASRDASYAPLVMRFLSHPTPRVRFNATIALGRMNAQQAYEALIGRLDPAETVQNVRLGARKALQALSGGIDRGYDAKQWRREFERKRQEGQPAPDKQNP